MKKIMVEESLYEFAKRGRPRKKGRKPKLTRGIDAPDAWNDVVRAVSMRLNYWILYQRTILNLDFA
jgi:hypothetical protein